jgi:hypothetical protein
MREVGADDLSGTNDHNKAVGEKQTNLLSTQNPSPIPLLSFICFIPPIVFIRFTK